MPNSKEKILSVALELFARYGYDGTTIKRISQTAGVAQGLMYNYFDSKEALLRAIFTESMQDVQASFAAGDQGVTPQEKIENLLKSSFELVQKNRQFWRLYHALRLQPAVLEKLDSDVTGWSQTIEEQLEIYLTELNFPVPATEAKILFALIDGIIQHYVIAPVNYPIDAVTARVIERYRGGHN